MDRTNISCRPVSEITWGFRKYAIECKCVGEIQWIIKFKWTNSNNLRKILKLRFQII